MMIVRCTCGIQLQVDEAYIGQNVQCSQCGQMLSIMSPQAAPPTPPDDIPVADFAPAKQSPLSPPAGAPAQTARRPRRPNALLKSLRKPWVMASIGGAVLLLIMLMFLLGGGGAAGGRLDLTYLPTDTKVVHYVRLAELIESGMDGKLARDRGMQQRLELVEKKLGIKATNVKSILFGYRDKDAKTVMESASWSMLGRQPIDFVGVVRMESKQDWKTLMSWLGKSGTAAAV